jgi:hypothetical protein
VRKRDIYSIHSISRPEGPKHVSNGKGMRRVGKGEVFRNAFPLHLRWNVFSVIVPEKRYGNVNKKIYRDYVVVQCRPPTSLRSYCCITCLFCNSIIYSFR